MWICALVPYSWGFSTILKLGCPYSWGFSAILKAQFGLAKPEIMLRCLCRKGTSRTTPPRKLRGRSLTSSVPCLTALRFIGSFRLTAKRSPDRRGGTEESTGGNRALGTFENLLSVYVREGL